MRWLMYSTVAALAVVAFAVSTTPAYALMIAFKPPAQRALSAEVVMVGKVTAIEKEMVEALPFPQSPNKVSYKVAVVKIESGLAGTANITHVKIGFIPPAKPNPNVQPPAVGVRPVPPIGRFQTPELKEGAEMLFFLSKHPTGEFYVIPNMSPPVELNEAGKKELEAVKKITAVIADPMKALKNDKADVRTEAAAVMVMKYRSYPETGGEVDQVAIDAEESKLILNAMAEAQWSQGAIRPVPGGAGGAPNALQAFYSLQLTDKDGWTPPKFVRPKPGDPPVDFAAVQKKAFLDWRTGAGKDYVIKKVVSKKKADR